MKTAIELPENPDELRQLTLKLMQDLEVAQKRMRWFEEMVRQAQLARFGRKTERFDANQLSLLDEDVDADISELEAQLANEFPDIPETKAKPCRLVLPETLPREESRKELDSNECPDCGEALRWNGNPFSYSLLKNGFIKLHWWYITQCGVDTLSVKCISLDLI